MNREFTAVTGAMAPSVGMNNFQDRACGLAQVPGLLIGGDPVLCADELAAFVTQIHALVIGYRVFTVGAVGATIGVADVEGGGGAFVSATWYNLYARDNAGVLAWQLSTTPPDEARIFKAGGTTHRYLGSFYAPTTSSLRRARREHGRVVYYDALSLGSGFSASSFTAVNLGATIVPPHARVIHLGVLATGYTGPGQVELQPNVSPAPSARLVAAGDVGAGAACADVALPLNGASNFAAAFNYRVTGGGTATLYCHGYED